MTNKPNRRMARYHQNLRIKGGDRIGLILPPDAHAKLKTMQAFGETRQDVILRLIRDATTPAQRGP